MTVLGLPVRFAETVNRLGAARVERPDSTAPKQGVPVLVTLGQRTLLGRAHGQRVTRRGRQALVSVHGRLSWVASHRVEPLGGGTDPGVPVAGTPTADEPATDEPTMHQPATGEAV